MEKILQIIRNFQSGTIETTPDPSERSDALDSQGICSITESEAHIHKVVRMRHNQLVRLHVIVSKES